MPGAHRVRTPEEFIPDPRLIPGAVVVLGAPFIERLRGKAALSAAISAMFPFEAGMISTLLAASAAGIILYPSGLIG